MHIYVDADACPKVIKEILFRAVKRTGLRMTIVANKPLYTPESDLIDKLIVPGGYNMADEKIIELVQDGDLVITADIPLAAAVIEKGATALNPRGTVYTENNIGPILGMRNLMDELRSSGIETGGPSAFGKKDRETFANALNTLINTHTN